MPEIEFTTGDSGGSGGGDFDINRLLDQMEQAMERIERNPQLAKAMGLDMDEITGDISDAQEQVESDGKDIADVVDADFIISMLAGVEANGYGDMTVAELRQWVDNHRTVVNQMIQNELDG